MDRFVMRLSDEKRALLERIVDRMKSKFGVTEAEAIARVNEKWHRSDLSGNDSDVILHETADYWANEIYHEPTDYSTWPNPPQPPARPAPPHDSGFWTLPDS